MRINEEGKLTVESELSPIFFPTNLFVHSSVLDCSPPEEVIPGTTRGILRFVLVVKVFSLRGWTDLMICIFGKRVNMAKVMFIRREEACLPLFRKR